MGPDLQAVRVAADVRREWSRSLRLTSSTRTPTSGTCSRTLSPSAREQLREVLIRDQANRDAIASQLLRYRDGRGDDWADIIDMLTIYPDERRRVVRLLGQLEAESEG